MLGKPKIKAVGLMVNSYFPSLCMYLLRSTNRTGSSVLNQLCNKRKIHIVRVMFSLPTAAEFGFRNDHG